MVKIEKGVPLPRGLANREKYPFAAMEVSDSFFVASADDPNGRNRIEGAAQYRRRKGERYTVRAVDGGFRVWRVA